MKIWKPWIIILVGGLLSLGMAMSESANAITHATAFNKAKTYQAYECGAYKATCEDSVWKVPRCSGPYGGTTQWVCDGKVILSYSDAFDECVVISRWGPWGNLNFGRRYCTSLPVNAGTFEWF